MLDEIRVLLLVFQDLAVLRETQWHGTVMHIPRGMLINLVTCQRRGGTW